MAKHMPIGIMAAGIAQALHPLHCLTRKTSRRPCSAVHEIWLQLAFLTEDQSLFAILRGGFSTLLDETLRTKRERNFAHRERIAS